MEFIYTLIVCTLLLFGFPINSYAQGVISCTEMNLLYRNYKNVIEVGTGGYKKEVVLVSNELNLSKIDSTSSLSYYAVPSGSSKEAFIYVVSKNLKDTLSVKKYRIMSIQPPVMHLGESEDGGSVNASDSVISIHFGSKAVGPSTYQYEVLVYELIVQGEPNTFKGKGNTFSPEIVERLRYLSESRRTPIEITIQSTIKGPDGVTRKKSGSFKLE